MRTSGRAGAKVYGHHTAARARVQSGNRLAVAFAACALASAAVTFGTKSARTTPDRQRSSLMKTRVILNPSAGRNAPEQMQAALASLEAEGAAIWPTRAAGEAIQFARRAVLEG